MDLFLFHGDVDVAISTMDDDTFGNKLNKGGEEMSSLFTSFIPYGNVIGSAKNIFELIDCTSEPALTSAGEAEMRSYWSRIDPDGGGEKGKEINRETQSKDEHSDYQLGMMVYVGHYVAIYRDLSTRFQQRSEGYYDFGNLKSPPDLSAKIELTPKQNTLQVYYRITRTIGVELSGSVPYNKIQL